MSEPNLKRIRLWYEALRSGDYKQGKETLAQVTVDNGVATWTHCCLGVATEVAVQDKAVASLINSYIYSAGLPEGHPRREKSWSAMGGLPNIVRQWYGLSIDSDEGGGGSDPFLVIDDDDHQRASNLNDNKGYTFNQIADAIARTWPEILNPEYDPS
jgi:hypothetical protein